MDRQVQIQPTEFNGNTTHRPLALIIENDPKQATIFAGALHQADYRTELVFDGRTALDRLATITPAVVVLDLHLPQVSGVEILQRLRANQRFNQTRVLLATADIRLAEPLRPQADLVILKPINYGQLRDLVSRLHTRVAETGFPDFSREG